LSSEDLPELVLPPGLPALGHLGDLAPHLGHLLPDPAPVELDLGLAGAAGGDAAARAAAHLAGQRLAPAAQPGQHVLHLGERDLRLALAGLGVLGEDVQDQRGPVHDLDLDHLFEVGQLGRGELAVADHRVRAGLHDDVAQLLGLAGADVGGGVGPVPALDQRVQDHRARGLGQGGQLAQGCLGVRGGARRPDAHQDHALEAQLPVLDLGDVLEFGGQAGDPAKRLPLGEVQLVSVVAVTLLLVSPIGVHEVLGGGHFFPSNGCHRLSADMTMVARRTPRDH
jgi:hypothetical protein